VGFGPTGKFFLQLPPSSLSLSLLRKLGSIFEPLNLEDFFIATKRDVRTWTPRYKHGDDVCQVT